MTPLNRNEWELAQRMPDLSWIWASKKLRKVTVQDAQDRMRDPEPVKFEEEPKQ